MQREPVPRLPSFIKTFRDEPLLYRPLHQAGDPHLMLRASLAQTILQGLVRNLPRQGLVRETYQLLRLARRMEQSANRRPTHYGIRSLVFRAACAPSSTPY